MIKHLLSELDFNEFVKEGNVVVDFYATWCGPCRMLAPIIEDLSEENPNIKFGKLDVDQVSQVASRYMIQSIPTLLFFKDGTLVHSQIGFSSQEALEDTLEKSQNKYNEIINSEVLDDILDSGMHINIEYSQKIYEKMKKVIGLGRN